MNRVPDRIRPLLPALASAAQRAYDEWDQNDEGIDEVLGPGGVCQDVAENMADVLVSKGIEAQTVSAAVGDQHVYVVVQLPDGVYTVDIPPGVYEAGAGYNWRKIPGVRFEPGYVVVDKLDDDPGKYGEYSDVWASEATTPNEYPRAGPSPFSVVKKYAAFWKADEVVTPSFKGYVEIFKNPTLLEIADITSHSQFGVRLGVDRNHDIYAWDANILHDTIESMFGLHMPLKLEWDGDDLHASPTVMDVGKLIDPATEAKLRRLFPNVKSVSSYQGAVPLDRFVELPIEKPQKVKTEKMSAFWKADELRLGALHILGKRTFPALVVQVAPKEELAMKVAWRDPHEAAWGVYHERYQEELERALDNIFENRPPKKLMPLNTTRMKKIWNDYAKTGVVRDERGIDDILEDFLNKVVRIDVNNYLAGHTSGDPLNEFRDRELPIPKDIDDRIERAIADIHGEWMISDYGLDYLVKWLHKAMTETDYEQKLLALDSMLNVVHQRSNLASWFVRGGRRALNELAGKEDTGLPEHSRTAADSVGILFDPGQAQEIVGKVEGLMSPGKSAAFVNTKLVKDTELDGVDINVELFRDPMRREVMSIMRASGGEVRFGVGQDGALYAWNGRATHDEVEKVFEMDFPLKMGYHAKWPGRKNQTLYVSNTDAKKDWEKYGKKFKDKIKSLLPQLKVVTDFEDELVHVFDAQELLNKGVVDEKALSRTLGKSATNVVRIYLDGRGR